MRAREESSQHLGNVMPHDILTEETRGAQERRKHADDADESRATRLSQVSHDISKRNPRS